MVTLTSDMHSYSICHNIEYRNPLHVHFENCLEPSLGTRPSGVRGVMYKVAEIHYSGLPKGFSRS
jgi:hypothetical protein